MSTKTENTNKKLDEEFQDFLKALFSDHEGFFEKYEQILLERFCWQAFFIGAMTATEKITGATSQENFDSILKSMSVEFNEFHNHIRQEIKIRKEIEKLIVTEEKENATQH